MLIRFQEWLYRSRRKLATGAVGVITMLFALQVVLGDNGMLTYMKKRAEYRKLLEENAAIQRENERLAQQIKALKTDPQAIEKEAREHLKYARPGEVVYTLPEPRRPPAQPQSAQKK